MVFDLFQHVYAYIAIFSTSDCQLISLPLGNMISHPKCVPVVCAASKLSCEFCVVVDRRKISTKYLVQTIRRGEQQAVEGINIAEYAILLINFFKLSCSNRGSRSILCFFFSRIYFACRFRRLKCVRKLFVQSACSCA